MRKFAAYCVAKKKKPELMKKLSFIGEVLIAELSYNGRGR
jgi:hypothetical protein